MFLGASPRWKSVVGNRYPLSIGIPRQILNAHWRKHQISLHTSYLHLYCKRKSKWQICMLRNGHGHFYSVAVGGSKYWACGARVAAPNCVPWSRTYQCVRDVLYCCENVVKFTRNTSLSGLYRVRPVRYVRMSHVCTIEPSVPFGRASRPVVLIYWALFRSANCFNGHKLLALILYIRWT